MDKTSSELIPNWHFTSYSFDDLDLEDQLLRNIYCSGMERPSHIQAKAIMALLKRKDVIAKSPPMTGKTMCYCIALLQMKFIYPEIRKNQALVVLQKEDHVRCIHEMFVRLGEELKVSVKMRTQVPDELEKETEKVQEDFQIIMATPESAYDMVKKGYLKMNEVKIIVIDDVDKIIEQGALENVKKILASAEKCAQRVIFSSRITSEIISLSEEFLEDPARIDNKDDDLTLDGIKQYYVYVEKEEWKNETLKELYDNIDITQSIVYCSTVQRVIELETWLKDKGMSVTCFHEDMEKNQQDQIQTQWRRGDFRILISTGFAPMKNEFACVYITFLYDLPANKERYIRLTGRRGRFGRKGVAIILATKDDMENLKKIEQYFTTEIFELPLDFSQIYD